MTIFASIFISKSSVTDIAGSAGRLYALLISHDQSAAQTVTLYDNSSASGPVLLTVHVAPERSPVLLDFTGILGGKLAGIPYAAGLSVAAPNCEVTLWVLQLT